MQRFYLLAILFFPCKILPTIVGNPADPLLQKTGLFLNAPSSVSLRAAYFGDYVYNQTYHEEFAISQEEAASSHLQIWTQAGVFTVNFVDRVDLYGILGGLRLQIGEEMLTPQNFAWGVGGKIAFFEWNRVVCGCDVKYLQSHPSPAFVVYENSAYNIVRDFYFDYREFQAALGVAYHTKYVSPYINGSYLIAKLDPIPGTPTVRFPMEHTEGDIELNFVTGTYRFGLTLGASLIDSEKASLNVEWRALNQNAIDVVGEIRF